MAEEFIKRLKPEVTLSKPLVGLENIAIPPKERNTEEPNKKRKHSRKKIPTEHFKTYTDGINSYIADAILGAVLMMIVTSETVLNIISGLNIGLYDQARKMTFKGRIILILIFAVIFVVAKTTLAECGS